MSDKFTINEPFVTLAEVLIFNDACDHSGVTPCDRCMCEWVNKKCAEATQRYRPALERIAAGELVVDCAAQEYAKQVLAGERP